MLEMTENARPEQVKLQEEAPQRMAVFQTFAKETDAAFEANVQRISEMHAVAERNLQRFEEVNERVAGMDEEELAFVSLRFQETFLTLPPDLPRCPEERFPGSG